jgi:hypothetical protein
MRRVVLKSPVLENCTPGSVRGALGNQRPYLAYGGRKPSKPPKATSMRHQSVLIARGLGPQSHMKATPMRPQGHPHKR